MRGEDARGGAGRAELARELVGKARRLGIAHGAPGVLHVAVRLRGKYGHVDAADGAGNAVAGGEVAHELLVLLGI